MRPIRLQRRRTKGWRKPPNTVCVDRSSRYGNPFRADVFGHGVAVKLFRNLIIAGWRPDTVKDLSDDLCHKAYVIHNDYLVMWRRKYGTSPLEYARVFLKGKNVACFCPLDHECHGDVWLEAANS